jgi:Tfp pilus assembly pilus retraction ATPase PilT
VTRGGADDMQALARTPFVDLYLGADFADMTGLCGAPERRPAPPELAAEMVQLRAMCMKKVSEGGGDEFSLAIAGVVYRVSAFTDVAASSVFVLRRSPAGLRPLASLGLPASLTHRLLARDMRGLVLVAGEMGAGKTSTAATLIVEWLKSNGGMAFALEDPPETPLNGVHGAGRCIQVPIRRKAGGYPEGMERAVRSGATLILIGEIRDGITAAEVVKASINGTFVISTIHAASCPEAIQRLVSMCKEKLPNAQEIIADGLSLVVYQQMSSIPIAPATPGGAPRQARRVTAQCLEVRNQTGVKAKLREGKFASLQQDVREQATRHAWAGQQAAAGAGVKR